MVGELIYKHENSSPDSGDTLHFDFGNFISKDECVANYFVFVYILKFRGRSPQVHLHYKTFPMVN